ncbi:MAG: OmpA family protein [Bacteroidota bacterium]
MIIQKKLGLLALLLSFGLTAAAQLPIQHGEVTVENETNINTDKLEFSPVFHKEGIVFISSENEGLRYAITDARISHNVFSIYQAMRDEEGNLGTSQPLARELLSDLHEGPLTFNTTGEIMYFTRNDSKATSNTSGNILKKMNIFSAQMTGDKWGNITSMPFNVPNYNTIHPTIAPDLDELYFSSDRAGGYGGYDLYVVRKIGGEWSTPVNLGPQVNTPDNEVFPFIHADGTLYFASNGHGGSGNLDLFYSTKSRDVWRRPLNMGEPFNTSEDDFGIIVDRDNRNGYFSSARSGGKGGDDIYRFSILADEIKDEILVTVIDAMTNEPLEGAEVSWINLNEAVLPTSIGSETLRLESITGENGEEIFRLNTGENTQSGITDFDGKFVFTLPDGEYATQAKKEGYLPTNVAFAVPPISGDNTFLIPLEKAVDCVPITGKVTDVAYGAPQSGANVVIKELGSGIKYEVLSGNAGEYEYCLTCGSEYEIYAEKGSGKSIVKTISTKDKPCDGELGFTQDLAVPVAGPGTTSRPIANNLDRTTSGDPYNSGSTIGTTNTSTGGSTRVYGSTANAPIKVGTIIQLPNIYYNFADAGLRTDARSDLDLVARMLQSYPEMEIELGSHTDSRGSDSFNKSLSKRRSESCVDYLIQEHGISSSRIRSAGYGETKPRNRCVNGRKCTEGEHQQNRRTEVIITRLGNSFSSLRNDAAIQELESYTVGTGGVDNRTYYGSEGSYSTGIDSYSDYSNDITTSRSTTATTSTNYTDSDSDYSVAVSNAKNYYVIAGTFRSAENATSRMRQVREQGYGEVEVIKFDYPNYHAVCVQRFNRENDARELVRQLQSNEINSYVRRID